MAMHSSILGWEIPWTKEPGVLQSTWSERVGHGLVTEQQQQFIYLWMAVLGPRGYAGFSLVVAKQGLLAAMPELLTVVASHVEEHRARL